MNTPRKPGFWVGALTGLLLTPPLIAVLAIGEAFAGLPFIPFDLFDWVARTLPGPLITFGIDTMVDLIIGLGLGKELAATAKIAERTIAITSFMGIGILTAALFFFVMRRIKTSHISYVPGVIAGLVLALPLMAIASSVNFAATADSTLSVIWTLMVFAGWGAALGGVYNALAAEYPMPKLKTDGSTETTVETIDRRRFLIQVGGAAATVTVVGTGLSSLLNTTVTDDTATAGGSLDGKYAVADGSGAPLPNANDPLTPAPGTRLEYTPVSQHYRIDIVSGAVPELDEATYTLPITGLVENPVEWTLEDVRAMPSMTEFITMSCISNRVGGSLISTTKWTGVSFQHLLEQVKPSADAKAIRITGADGFDEFIDLDLIRQDERIMLVYAWDDQPLPNRNGFPLRTHIPNRYGMKQPKWIDGMEFVDAWDEGYWVRRGWSRDAIVRATSVIDTVATEAIYDQRGASYVPIGGMAWAGARGISQVQVRIDGGDWQEAKLRSPMSDRTWNLWRFDWAFTEGNHLFEVRCVETDGTPQIESVANVRPDGATGIHNVRESVQKA